VRAAGAAHDEDREAIEGVEPQVLLLEGIEAPLLPPDGAEPQLLLLLRPSAFQRLAAGWAERRLELVKLPWVPLVHQCEAADVAPAERASEPWRAPAVAALLGRAGVPKKPLPPSPLWCHKVGLAPLAAAPLSPTPLPSAPFRPKPLPSVPFRPKPAPKPKRPPCPNSPP
jgi:hypothetical protein